LDRESGKTRTLRTNCPRRPTKGSIAMTSRAREDGGRRPVAAEVRHGHPLPCLCGRGQETGDDIGFRAAGRGLGRHRVHGSQWTNSVRSMFRRSILTPTNFVRCPQERKRLLGANSAATSFKGVRCRPSAGRDERASRGSVTRERAQCRLLEEAGPAGGLASERPRALSRARVAHACPAGRRACHLEPSATPRPFLPETLPRFSR
jgi:hypothetical protein